MNLGTDATDSPDPRLMLDEQGRVNGDVTCRRCGYNLRGLSGDGQCPECAAPVGRSVRGDLLQFCDPQWLQTLASGAYLVIMGMIPLIAGFILLGLWQTPRVWVLVLIVVSGAVVAAGLWKLTAPDPGVAEQSRQAASRRIIRICMIGMVLLPAGLTLVTQLPRYPRWGYVLITIAVGVTCIVAFFRHLQELARRMPDPAVEHETRIVMWGLAISFGLSTGLALMAIAPGSLPRPLGMIFGFWCTFIVGAQVFTIWSLTLIGKYHAKLKKAAQEADHLWTKTARAPSTKRTQQEAKS